MTLTVEDRLAIAELISLHGHLVDGGSLDRLGELFTADVVTELPDGRARARSKGLGVRADGSCGSVIYDDTLVRTEEGWRISHRRVSPRRVPLSGA